MLYNDTLKKLNSLLDKENIERSLDIYKSNIRTAHSNYKNKTKWYADSYPVIIKKFEESKGSSDHNLWIERIAYISSWLPTIPNPKLEKKSIEKLTNLENTFSNFRLEQIGVKFHQNERIFDTTNHPPILIQTFLEHADKITNNTGNWQGTLSTTTKLLHFMFPHLFPIFDGNINKIIFGGSTKNYAKYHSYLFALREYLQTSEEVEILQGIAKDMDISVIRAVDIILFNDEQII